LQLKEEENNKKCKQLSEQIEKYEKKIKEFETKLG